MRRDSASNYENPLTTSFMMKVERAPTFSILIHVRKVMISHLFVIIVEPSYVVVLRGRIYTFFVSEEKCSTSTTLSQLEPLHTRKRQSPQIHPQNPPMHGESHSPPGRFKILTKKVKSGTEHAPPCQHKSHQENKAQNPQDQHNQNAKPDQSTYHQPD